MNVILNISTLLWNILEAESRRFYDPDKHRRKYESCMQALFGQRNDAGTGCKANECTYEVYKCLYAVIKFR